MNYTNSYDTSFLYTWKSSDAVDGAITDLAPVNNTKAGYTGTDGDSAYRCCSGVAGTMAWDHDADVLYWASCYNTSYFQTYRYLWTMDTATGKATRVNTTYTGESETANPAVSGSITYSPAQRSVYRPGPEASGRHRPGSEHHPEPVRNEAPAGLHHRTDRRGHAPGAWRTSPSPGSAAMNPWLR